MAQPSQSEFATHEVLNQPPPRRDVDLWKTDRALRHWSARFGADAAALAEYGAEIGSAENRERGMEANRSVPALSAFDRSGRRIDKVRFHPAYHDLLGLGIKHGYHSAAWEASQASHATHASMVYMTTQTEPGVCCPLTMTYASVPALADEEGLAKTWIPKILSRQYDSADASVEKKAGATLGMAMTEKQGGSDVRANTTSAVPDQEGYRLTGHKWFCSAPMSDGFLTLAHAPKGLTCFLVPRVTPDGEKNAIHILRLKDKLGNRANASAEIEYHSAFAWKIGEEGQGVKNIIKMVHHTRLDTSLAPAGLMRAALAEAWWWCESRTAFQKRLIDQPLMRSVLADMALDWEGSLALGMMIAKAYGETGPERQSFARIAVALLKYMANKRCAVVVNEAMECLGGMGYVEETPMPLLYREAPLNSIWEGSGNVICLDIMRTLVRDSLAGQALEEALDSAKGLSAAYDAALERHRSQWPDGLPAESEARWFAESLAALLAASTLLREGDCEEAAQGYLETRLGESRGLTLGAVRSGSFVDALVARLGPG